MSKAEQQNNKDSVDTRHLEMHQPDAIRERLSNEPKSHYLRDFVYGGIDGAVTTFAVVSGVAGAGLQSEIVIILGVANLIGDGFSMAASNYLGVKTDKQLLDRARDAEEKHIEVFPEGEKEEIRQILSAKGFHDDHLEDAVEVITSDRKIWVDTMLKDELGLSLNHPNPWIAATTTFGAFILIGVLPLISFIWDLVSKIEHPFLMSTLLTGAAFFTVGAIKSRFVMQKWYWSGMETLFVGGMAAALAYIAGLCLKGVIN